jgi:hypothetical protein
MKNEREDEQQQKTTDEEMKDQEGEKTSTNDL